MDRGCCRPVGCPFWVLCLEFGEADETSSPDRRARRNFHAFGARRPGGPFLLSLCRGTVAVRRRTCKLPRRARKHGPGSHWSDYAGRWRQANKERKDLGLVEFCQPYETVELWFDPRPNDQLQLVWLLDFFRSHPEIVPRLKLRLLDYDLIQASPEELGRWLVPAVDVTKDELETAAMAWQTYRAATPEACFDLLDKDLSALPLLRPALLDLIEELPSSATGLGATEMRLLGTDRKGIRADECALSPSRAPPAARIQRLGNRFPARGPRARSDTSRCRPRRRATHDQERELPRPRRGVQAKPAVANRVRLGDCRAQGRFQPLQSDRSLVGRHQVDE